MKRHLLFSILLLAVVIMVSSCEPTRLRYNFDWARVQSGDSIAWKAPDYNDEHWGKFWEFEEDGVFWSRMKVVLPPEDEERKSFGLQIVATASYEAYWDGVYLGTNGRLGTDGYREKAGTYQWFTPIPDSLLADGAHTLALRGTMDDENLNFHSYFFIDEYFNLTRGPLQISKYMFLLAGAFLITAIYFLLLFASQPKEYANLLFGVICLTFLSLLLMEYLKLFYLYPYPFQYIRLELIGYLHALLFLLTPLFFIVHFDFKWKTAGTLILILVVVYMEYRFHDRFDWIARKYTTLIGAFSALIIGYAIYEKRKGAIWVMASLVVSFFLVKYLPLVDFPYMASYDVSVFVAFILLAVTMLYVMSLKRRSERQAYEASLVRSERLKNELLKKNIRPHFIMNTLTSLIDWVEESPKEGVAFIHALADEFELLNEIADYKQIPIGQEIRLCKNHLKVMGYRKEVRYVWEDEAVDVNDIIPPAIIHTAVENGVTHGLPGADGSIIFRLSSTTLPNGREYILRVIAEKRSTGTLIQKGASSDGTGVRYIKSRLQESYQDRWEFISRPTNEGWETIIRLYDLVTV
ncbi:MAG: histidine kinase [Bacteroidota bacterium]